MSRITKNDLEVWKSDPVTQEFLKDIFLKLEDEQQRFIHGSPEDILRIVYARNEAMKLLQEVLDWEPQEIINNEE